MFDETGVPTTPVDGFENHVGRFVVWREEETSPFMMGVVACREPEGWQIQIGKTFPNYEACNSQCVVSLSRLLSPFSL